MPLTLKKLFSEKTHASFGFLGETVNVTWAPYRYTGDMQDLYEQIVDAGEADEDAIAQMEAQARALDEEFVALAAKGEKADDEELRAKRRESALLRRRLDAARRRTEASARKAMREALSAILVSWDVLDDKGVPLPTDLATLTTLPTGFLWVVFGSLSAENRPDPQKAPSSDEPSNTGEVSAPSQTGSRSSRGREPSESPRSSSTNGRTGRATTRSGASGR